MRTASTATQALRGVLFLVAASATATVAHAQPLAWTTGWSQEATIKEVLKLRHLFNPNKNGYEMSLGPGESPPYTTVDFYRGATCAGTTPYGSWSSSGRNHVRLSYDPETGVLSARVDAQDSYCPSYQVGNVGALNYLQLDLRGQVANGTNEIVALRNATLNGAALADVVGDTSSQSWYVADLSLTGGFSFEADVDVSPWPPSNTGCDECTRLVLRIGHLPPPAPPSEPVPATPVGAWMGLAGALGIAAWMRLKPRARDYSRRAAL